MKLSKSSKNVIDLRGKPGGPRTRRLESTVNNENEDYVRDSGVFAKKVSPQNVDTARKLGLSNSLLGMSKNRPRTRFTPGTDREVNRSISVRRQSDPDRYRRRSK